jgi:LacI family transcriptional regulator
MSTAGKDKPGKPLAAVRGQRVTMKELAAHLGVSITTVSRGLKGAADIGPETIAMVRRAAREAGYTPDARGVKLRTGQTFTICYLKAILPQQDVPDAAVAAQFDAIASFLKSTPYQLQIVPWNPAEDDAIEILGRIVGSRLADGVLLDLTQPRDERVLYLLEHDFPFVSFGRTELFTEHPFVDANSEKAAFDATVHLLACGHKRIALMGAQLPFTFNLQRRRGYQRALDEAGIALDPALVRADGVGASAARTVVAGLLAMPDAPTGFICGSESSALGAMAGIRDCGKEVGRDCDVVARVSSSLNDYLNPPLATCHLDIQEVARTMSDFLLRRIAGEPANALQRVFDCSFHVPAHQKL